MTTEHDLTGGRYLYGSGGTATGSGIVMDGRLTVPGNTYLAEFRTGSGSPDNGFLFGAQTTRGWGSYSGYLVLINDSEDQTQLQRWDNGSRTILDSGPEWPRHEDLTLEIDYRDSSDRISCTVYDSNDDTVVELSSKDATYGEGHPGFYHWRDDDFRVYSLRDSDWEPTSPFESELFDHLDLESYYRGFLDGFDIVDVDGDYALTGDGYSDEETLAFRKYRELSAGNTYTTEVEAEDGADFGLLFGGTDADTFDEYSGYALNFQLDSTNEVRLEAYDNGTTITSDTDTAPPAGERLVVEIDYRDRSDSKIRVTIFDSDDNVVAELVISDQTFDVGGLGFHQWVPIGFYIFIVIKGAHDATGTEKWDMYVNHGDGTGEHKIGSMDPFDRLYINTGDGEELVIDNTE